MDLLRVLCWLYLVVSKKPCKTLNLGGDSKISKLRTSDINIAFIGDDPKYKPTLDIASQFFALAFSASGVNA